MTQTYQLKVTLRGTKPAIWRRLVVPGNMNLERLHRVIQDAMGWDDAHLHSFEVDGVELGMPDPDGRGFSSEMKPENRHTLERLVGVKDRFTYRYDFGDDWVHQIVVEKVTPGEPSAPRVVAGARACPPEDCGGVWRYAELVGSLANEDHARDSEWVPEGWAPERFDLALADARVARHQPQPEPERARAARKPRAPRTLARARS